MNWDALGAIGELIGGLAVIATLAYLAIQIRENNRMMKIAAKRDQASQTKELALLVFEHPEVFQAILGEADLDETQTLQAQMWGRSVLRIWESYCFAREHGQFDEMEWNAFTNTIERFMKVRAMRESYADMRAEFSPRLQVLIDPLCNDDES